jgi:oligopeptide/dipeptide ABC transporter ATP-binding protein
MSRSDDTMSTTDQIRNVLEVRDLSVSFPTEDGVIRAVRRVSFDIPLGKTVAIIGESGCGKTVTALALLGIVDLPGKVDGGSAIFRGWQSSYETPLDMLQLDPAGEEIRRVRGRGISMIFQDPVASLTPVYTIGEQIIETLMVHQMAGRKEARRLAVLALESVGIPSPHLRVDSYPHQLSGGMCQRAMIAMAVCGRPRLLIADEPTTALDVTIQAQVLDLLRALQSEYGTSILLITHDLGVAAEMADEVVVMYLGRVVEKGCLESVIGDPKHPYTRALIASLPGPEIERQTPLHTIRGIVPDFMLAPEGCPFRTRCDEEMHICREEPRLLKVDSSHEVACWLHDEDETWLQRGMGPISSVRSISGD